jgi:putative tryptophan/tyrosine transport system substrate-binding protein
MRRRDLLLLIAATGCGVVRAVAAQPRRKPIIGWLSINPLEGNLITDAILAELEHLGWVDGRSAELDYRIAGAQLTGLPALADALVERKVDIIIAPSPLTAQAAQRATATIPIIGLADDMQGSRLVGSLAHPGGNITGVSIFAAELDAKRLALLIEMVPTARRVAALVDSRSAPSVPQVDAAARALGRELVLIEARNRDEIDAALDAIAAASVDAVNVVGSSILHAAHQTIIDRMAAAKLPAIYQWPEYAQKGALAAYGPRQALIGKLVAEQVDRVLRGEAPEALPIVQPTTFEFAINLKAAKALGLSFSPTLLARADEVIE